MIPNIYICKKNAYCFFQDWFNNIGLKNIKIYTSLINFYKQDRIIILYPQYLSFLKYFYLRTKVFCIISVIHGHFNSYSNNKLKKGFSEKIFNKFKNNLKDLYFLLFDNIICYSSHIFIDSKSLISPKVHKKLILINEFLNLPQLEYSKKSKHYKNNNLRIGFLNFPENKEIYSLYKLIKKNNNVTCIEGWKYNLKDIKSYLEFLDSCNIIVFGKNNFYNLQVSGVINDCISLKKIIFASSKNKHYSNLINVGLIKKEWTISNQLEENLLLPKNNQIKKFENDCVLYLKNLKLENNKNINTLLDKRKVVLSYQGRENGGGLLDLYRFAYNEKIIKKNKLSILTRSKKKLGNTFLTTNLTCIEDQCEFITDISYLFKSKINQIIFIMPNIRDLILLILFKIFKKNTLITSIIHNTPNFSSTNNNYLNEIFKSIERLMLFLADDIIFLSRQVSKKWENVDQFRIVPLPLVSKNENYLSNIQSNNPEKFNKKRKKLLILGRYLPYKDLNILIDSINSKKNRSKHILTIAGKNYPKGDILKLKKECKKNNWEFNYIDKFIRLSDVEILLKENDYVLFLYSVASQSGFMHLSKEFKKAIICTDVGSLKENLENGGKGFCIKRDTKELTKILNMIYSNQILIPSYKKFKKNAVL